MSRTGRGLAVAAGLGLVAALVFARPAPQIGAPSPFDPKARSLPVPAAQPGGWTESASRDFYDSALNLKWRHYLGDWRDAAGDAQGDKAFATAHVARGDRAASFDVTRYVQLHGGDLMVRAVSGGVDIVSREGGGGAPLLTVVKRGEEARLTPTADAGLEPSTYRSMGTNPAMRTAGPVLIRFAQTPHPSVTRATLTLTFTGPAAYPAELAIFQPDAGGDVAMPRFRPAGPGDTVARWTGADLARHKDWIYNVRHARVDGTILTAWIPRDDLTALSLIEPLPGGEQAFATVVMRFAPDWEPLVGGKLPGLANTGQGKPPVDGLGASGWGGRQANGLRWSARTGYDGFDPLAAAGKRQTGLHSYFYALSPPSVWGTADPWSRPVPKGRWFAYTEYVRLNAVGRDDGALGYWLDGAPVHYRDGIRWRTKGGRESEINEFWFDVYCGGTQCGPVPHAHEHAFQIASVAVTRALPDFPAVQREVDRLNGGK